MSIYTNGNKVAYLDVQLNAGVVYCTQVGRVTCVCLSLSDAIHVIDKGLQYVIRESVNGPSTPPALHGHNKQIRDEFVRKAASRYPMAYIF